MSYSSPCLPSEGSVWYLLGAREMICPETEGLSRPGGNFACLSLLSTPRALWVVTTSELSLNVGDTARRLVQGSRALRGRSTGTRLRGF